MSRNPAQEAASYRVQLRAAEATISELEARIEALEKDEAARQKLLALRADGVNLADALKVLRILLE